LEKASQNKKNKVFLTLIALIGISIIAVIIFKMGTPKAQVEDVNVYFSKVSGADVVVEPVERHLPKTQDPLSYAMAELMEGPTEEEKDKGYFSEIPEGTRVISITEQPGEVRINLNKQFVSGGGSNSVVNRLKELSNTALEAEPVRKVYLEIDGELLETIGGEGLEVIQPLQKNNLSADEDNSRS
jgi:spore germination protein GerM